MNLYIDYSEFELTCWNTDGKGTNVAIPLTEEQAKKICDIIGLLGFAEENGKIVGYHRAKELMHVESVINSDPKLIDAYKTAEKRLAEQKPTRSLSRGMEPPTR